MSTISAADNQHHGTIRILHVEDDPDFAGLAATFLTREEERFEIDTVHAATEGLDRLGERDFDCIISDYDMPGQNGIEFLDTVREAYPDLPFILFTGKGSEKIASKAISAGATDYLQKGHGTDQYELLANRVQNVVSQYRAVREARTTQYRLQELAEGTTDCLWMFTADWDELLFISGYETVWNRPTEAIERDPQDFLESIDPEDREFVERELDELSDGESIDIEFKILRGEAEQGWVWVKGQPIFDDDGNVVRVVGFTRDITDRKEREQEMERYLDLFEQAQEIASIGA
ncbi:MAG: response regulator, partial [Halanaeroarchaeum sp.]